MITLSTTNLTKWFEPNKKALENLNIRVEASRLCFLGQNGSGKTTILSMIAGLISPSKGSLIINGVEPYRNREETLKFSTFLFEKPKLPYRMKVKEFVNFLKNTHDLSDDFERMLDILNIQEFSESRLFELSSGQEQLVNILAAFSRESSRVIADEIFTHIDIFRAANIINYMQKMNRDLIFSTHVPEEAEALADYIVILNEGRIIWHGTIENLYESNIFEVYLKRDVILNLKYIFRYGNIALVESDTKTLSDLLENGKIIGYRKSGVLRIYEQFNNDY